MIRWRKYELACAGLAAASMLAAAACGACWCRMADANRAIAALAAGYDVAVDHDAPARAQAARGLFLVRQHRLEEAMAVAERLDGDPVGRAALLYALGNAHMRRGLAIFADAPIREVAPLINQAKAEYRLSLQLQPQNWDARFNYDVAASLVRDQDPPPPKKGDEMSRERALIPDLPGVPNGLP
jgi:mxaK protein